MFQRVPQGGEVPEELALTPQQQLQQQAVMNGDTDGGSSSTATQQQQQQVSEAGVAAAKPFSGKPKLPARKQGVAGSGASAGAHANGSANDSALPGTGDRSSEAATCVVPTAAPRALKFDPLKGMSQLHAAGVDISMDGAAARSDASTLPTDTG